jgi:hypothetical protein
MPGEQTEGRFSADANLTLVVSIMFTTPLKPSFQSTSAARASRSSAKRSWNLMIRAGSTVSVRSSSPGKCRTRLRALLNVRPTTLAGVTALLRYAVEANVDDQVWPVELLTDETVLASFFGRERCCRTPELRLIAGNVQNAAATSRICWLGGVALRTRALKFPPAPIGQQGTRQGSMTGA